MRNIPLRRFGSAVDIAERHARVLWSLQDCLLELSRRNPLVLLIDDIHTVDAESLNLIAALALEYDLAVLQKDRDFHLIAKVFPLRLITEN